MIQVRSRQANRSPGDMVIGPVGQGPVQEDGRQEEGDLADGQADEHCDENPGHLPTVAH